MNLLDNIKKVRLTNGFSQEYMADKLGIATVNYGKIERGKTQMTIDRLYEIAGFLNVSVVSLLEIEVPKTENPETEILKAENEFLRSRINELEEKLADKKQLEEYFKRDIFELRTIVTFWPKLSYDTEVERIKEFFKEKKISKADYEKMLSDLPDKLAESIVVLIKNNISLLAEFERELKATKYQTVLEKVHQQLNQ